MEYFIFTNKYENPRTIFFLLVLYSVLHSTGEKSPSRHKVDIAFIVRRWENNNNKSWPNLWKKNPTKLLNLANADRASYENKNRSLYRHVNTHTHVCTSYSPWEKASFLYWSLTRSFLGRHTYLLAVTWTIQALTSLWLFPLAGILPLVALLQYPQGSPSCFTQIFA